MKKQQHKTKPIRSKEEVATHPDPRIDQDFPGFPHPPSQEKIITPQNGEDKDTASSYDKKDATKKKKTGNDEVLRKELDTVTKRKKKR